MSANLPQNASLPLAAALGGPNCFIANDDDTTPKKKLCLKRSAASHDGSVAAAISSAAVSNAKMTGMENVNLSIRHIPAIGFRLREVEREVILNPDHQQARLLLAHPCLQFSSESGCCLATASTFRAAAYAAIRPCSASKSFATRPLDATGSALVVALSPCSSPASLPTALALVHLKARTAGATICMWPPL